MSKFSVKKPYTVLIAVLVVIMLGVVSLTKMQMDLLPEISLPYLLVITTYPGASPEKVETAVSKPMESGLGTITGIKNVNSVSNENYSLVQLEFEDDTNMDNVLVKVSTQIDAIKSYLPEECGTPQIMELSTDMLASMYVSVSYDGMEMEELSRFVEDTVIPSFERQDGVANVTSVGLVEKTLQVELNEEKVEELNNKILAKANDALADAMEQLDDAKKKLEDGQKELNNGKNELVTGQKELDDAKAELEKGKNELSAQEKNTYAQLAQASQALDQLAAQQATLLNQQARQGALAGLTGTPLLVNTCLTGGSFNSLIAMAPSVPTDPNSPKVIEATIGALELWQAPPFTTLNAQLKAHYAEYLVAVESGDTTLITAAEGNLTTDLLAIDAALSAAPTTALLGEYASEATALELEITVTKQIIAGYEEQLKKLGVNYADIESAKLQAAAGFGSGYAQIAAGESALESAQAQLDGAKDTMKDAQKQLDDGWEQYNDALEEFEKQKDIALKNANADQLLSLATLSGLIYAQNFEMPAGYIDDKDDVSWLLKVGENYKSVDQIKGMVLVHIDDIGDIKLGDVADLTIIDNSMDTYAKLNNDRAVILSIFKASTSGTNEVSKVLKAEIKELQEKYDGLNVLVLTDQGDYIEIIVNSVVQSMLLGAALAIVILAFFLRDVMPTIVVAISIPLSVLTSLVAMYFSNISLNMMSLSGMALGIGMLVDNSIVVIENIYRLRGRGIEAPRAAVQGTRQVAGAVIASTLTSVCVFFPMVYTTGMVRELMLPMSLTIIYCLLASLLVAMTVVPAASSTLLRKTKVKEHKFFDKIQNVYGKALDFCLRVKIVPLGIAIGLLGLTLWQVLRMGIVMIPEMTSNQIEASVTFDEEEISREDAYSLIDELLYESLEIDGIDSIGVMMGGSGALFGATDNNSYENFSLMVITENEKIGAQKVHQICDSMTAIAEKLGLEDFSISTGMSEMSTMLGSGLTVSIYGDDLETLRSVSEDVMEIVDSIEGYTEISNGQEEADQVLHLYVDKDKAMGMGLSVAQIYQKIAEEMKTNQSSITVSIDGIDMAVEVVDKIDPLSYENLMDMAFEVTTTDEDGKSVTEDKLLKDLAELKVEDGFTTIRRENQNRYIQVTANVEEGYNTTLLTRELEPLIEKYDAPEGYSVVLGGEYETVMKMVSQMSLIILMGVAFIYFVMVAQFQSLLSPFIVLFTLPLAFTGGAVVYW